MCVLLLVFTFYYSLVMNFSSYWLSFILISNMSTVILDGNNGIFQLYDSLLHLTLISYVHGTYCLFQLPPITVSGRCNSSFNFFNDSLPKSILSGTNINNNVASEGKQNNSADPKASGGITRRQNGEVQTSQGTTKLFLFQKSDFSCSQVTNFTKGTKISYGLCTL